jgi:predicted TIM-barrel fold metal-dependent hydrolase
MRRNLISGDGHVIEPDDLWLERLPAELRASAPQVRLEEKGRVLVVNDERRNIPGLNFDFPLAYPWAVDPVERAAVLEEQGIGAETLYPQWAMLLYGLEDSDLQTAVLRAYNEWLADFCAAAPGRFIGIGLLPIHDMVAAREEIEHVQALGLKGVSIPSKRKDLRYNDETFEPLWEAIERSGFPVSLHVAPTIEHWGKGAIAANITMNLGPFRSIWPIFVFSGILERHPGLRMVLTEGGIHWVAGTLYDMDMIHERFGEFLRPRLSVKPSEIWRRQCFATFQEDPVGIQVLDWIGAGNVVWGADFPHPEGTYPRTQELIASQFEKLPEEQVDAIVGGNARELWLS